MKCSKDSIRRVATLVLILLLVVLLVVNEYVSYKATRFDEEEHQNAEDKLELLRSTARNGPSTALNQRVIDVVHELSGQLDLTLVRHPAVLVTYVYHNPRKQAHLLENFLFFVEQAILKAPNSSVHYALTMTDPSPLNAVMESLLTARGVFVRHTPNEGSDICSHLTTLKLLFEEGPWNYSHVIFLNVGVRGPFLFPDEQEHWTSAFLSPLDAQTHTHIAGTTISCELAPHVQTFAFGVDCVGLRLVLALWRCARESHAQVIRNGEVGLSQLALGLGYNIASLLPQYHKRDFRIPGSEQNCNGRQNPTACRCSKASCLRKSPSIACGGINPQQLIFVKYGGEVWQRGFVSNSTKEVVEKLTHSLSGMQRTTQRPNFNLAPPRPPPRNRPPS